MSNYTDPSIDNPGDIAEGSDGALWFVNRANNSIGRITTSGVVTNYTDPSISSPISIAAGPDGALWCTNNGNNSIGQITTSGVVSNFTDATMSGRYGITAGSDGALWFTNGTGNSIGRITTTGTVTNYTDSTIDAPGFITAGSDGALWYGNCANSCSSIGRITTAGIVSNISDPSINSPGILTSGPDGNIWFPNFGNNSIGEILVGVPYVEVNPGSGTPQTPITLSGGGYSPGETVKVTWKTGLSSPTTETLCSTVVTGGGTFFCNASVPVKSDAGALGTHKILAKGLTSHAQANTTFTLTTSKIEPGSKWTLHDSYGPCEVQTFATGGTFTSDQYGDKGTYTNKKNKVSETYTAGDHSGEGWSGTYSNPNYVGAGTIPGTLILSPGASAGC